MPVQEVEYWLYLFHNKQFTASELQTLYDRTICTIMLNLGMINKISKYTTLVKPPQ
jgi:hypothetical protein